jgi:hypothetical protein
MARYYVNRNVQANGDHEVHIDIDGVCPTPPNPENRHHLGEFHTCKDAVREAKKFYPQSNGCKNCIPECHTQ